MQRNAPHSILHFFTRTLLPLLLLCAVLGAPVVSPAGEPAAKAAAVPIAAAQKVEHYEIASYGTLATLAQSLI